MSNKERYEKYIEDINVAKSINDFDSLAYKINQDAQAGLLGKPDYFYLCDYISRKKKGR